MTKKTTTTKIGGKLSGTAKKASSWEVIEKDEYNEVLTELEAGLYHFIDDNGDTCLGIYDNDEDAFLSENGELIYISEVLAVCQAKVYAAPVLSKEVLEWFGETNVGYCYMVEEKGEPTKYFDDRGGFTEDVSELSLMSSLGLARANLESTLEDLAMDKTAKVSIMEVRLDVKKV